MISLWAGSCPFPPDVLKSGCRRCGNEDGRLARYIKASGSVAIRWQCGRCSDYGTYGDIRHSFLIGFGQTIAELPICEDRRSTDTPCVVCGAIGTEWHHWAPTSIFSALPEWSDVGAYLCLEHHREWHYVMRAYGLRFPHELAAEAV